MTDRSTQAPWLEDIIDAIRRIREYVADLDAEGFANSRLVSDAVARNLEVISEATRHLPEDAKARFPDLPWRQIAALGNKMRHEYFRTDPYILWEIVASDLAPLETAVNRLLDDTN